LNARRKYADHIRECRVQRGLIPLETGASLMMVERIEQWCGVLAPIASILLCMSPIPTIEHILHDGKVGSYPLLPYTSMLLNTALWFAYGMLKSDRSLWITNGFAVLLSLCYWFTYIRFAHTATSISTLPGTVGMHVHTVLVTVVAIVVWATFPFVPDPSKLLGFVAMMSGIVLYASPLASLRVVMEAKCARSIPLPFTVTSLISCSLWATYGRFETHDLNVYIPGIIGCALSLAQLSLKIYYGDSLLTEIQDDIHVIIEEQHALLSCGHRMESTELLASKDDVLPLTYQSVS
jgi:solute carrier family 50 (sugar transporter)